MALGVFALVTAEFLPAGLLTPIAGDLGVTEGLAGQAVTTTAAVASIMALLAPTLTQRLDRRTVMLAFSTLVIASALLVSVATNVTVLFAGRILLGIALGGFWALSTPTIMRLVPPLLMPRAVSIVYSGISAATVLAIPFGSYVGSFAGWRVVFAITAGLGVVALLAQAIALPRLASRGATRLGSLLEVLRRPRLGPGFAAVILVFTGHFMFFTYIRPFLEGMAGIGVDAMSAILLGFGVAGFLGTYLAGFLLARRLRTTLVALPFAMSLLGAFLATLGGTPFGGAVPVVPLVAFLVALWGLAFGGVPVAWTTWAARAAPDQPESANALIVAAIGLAIALGAGIGGLVLDASNIVGVFVASSTVLFAAVLLTLLGGVGRKDDGE
jgi:predicted MFS family arabinose efflux permease